MRSLILKSILRTGAHATVRGVALVDIAQDEDTAQHLGKLSDALDLVHAVDPRRFGWIRDHLRRIAVFDGESALYHFGTATCFIDVGYLMSTPTEIVAMTLVHEATHARIAKAGITYGKAFRARIERLCVEEEAAFAAKLPQGQRLAAEARSRLEERWWETPAMFDRRVRQLRISGWPDWILIIYRFVFAPRSRPRSEDSSTAA